MHFWALLFSHRFAQGHNVVLELSEVLLSRVRGFKGKNPKFCISDQVSASLSLGGTHRAEKQSLCRDPTSYTSEFDIKSPWLHTKHSYIESTLMRLLCFLDERTPFFFILV